MSATWFRHDTNALQDRKLQALFMAGGYAHIGLWWAIVETLAAESYCIIETRHLDAIAFKLRVEKPALIEFLDTCCEIGLLDCDVIAYWSDGLTARMSEINKARDKKRQQRGQGEGQSPGQSQGQNKNVPGTGKGTVPKIGSNPSNPSNQIQSNQIKSNPATGGGGAVVEQVGAIPASANPPPPEADEYAPYRKYVDKYLCSPTEPPSPWEQDNLHIGAGKRPCRDFPLVWLTPTELCSVFKFYAEQIPDHDRRGIFKDCLQATQSDAQSYVSGGKPIGSYNAYARLTSWKLQDVVGARNSVKKLVGSLASSKSFAGARA